MSAGAITGITLAALFFTLLPIGYFIFRRNRPEAESKKPAYKEYDDVPDDARLSDSNSLKTDMAQTSKDGPIVGATTLGAATADYGHGGDILGEPGLILADDDEASSSQAGSSGWSSSAGISSLNTGSMDEPPDVTVGATLAGIGVASAFSRSNKGAARYDFCDFFFASWRYCTCVALVLDVIRLVELFHALTFSFFLLFDSDTDEGADIHSVSRDQLDQLIEAGDWAAVGATAALLAATSDSQSVNSMSSVSGERSRTSQSADAARAAELDHLVDAGDWEGVVAAAAKFEAQGDSQSHSRSSRSMEESSTASGTGTGTGTGTGSGTGTGTGSGTGTGTFSDSPSKVQKREEIRSEVEALVRRVVPEEIDNVDEMMNQFKGREEELVETLRTMQERAVAQKARQAGQKSAKIEARRSVQRGVVPGAGAAVAAAAGAGIAKAGAKKSSKVDPETARMALEQAIEDGDWDTVGEAAMLLGDDSSVSTTGSSKSKERSGPNAEKAAELDALIDRGDWTQVAVLANRFSGEEKGRKISKEEEDALKEAELWMKIAEQKKAEGATDAGASDAAEWAIQRSLSQLKEAEKKSEKKGGGNDEDEV